jgi:hypothetical protein
MRRIATILVTVLTTCVLHVPVVLAGGGFGVPPFDGKTVGPKLNVSVVMEGPHRPSVPLEPTLRQFAVRIDKDRHSQAVLFTGPSGYSYGCLQPGFRDLQTSTEQRFLGFLNNWFTIEALDALIRPFGDPDRAVIIDIEDVTCTPAGDKEYLSFTGRIKFAK